MSNNPRARNYNIGVYHERRFNRTDLTIRRDLGLRAQEFIPEKAVPLALRRIARNPPEEGFAIIPASKVLPNGRTDVYLLYMPIDSSAQSQPGYTPKRRTFLDSFTQFGGG